MTSRPAAAAGLARAALHALDESAVAHCLRNGAGTLLDLDAGGDIDVVVRRRDLRRADAAVTAAGWRRLRAPGHAHHRFYLARDHDANWVKLDLVSSLRYGDRSEDVAEVLSRRVRVDGVWSAADADVERHIAARREGRREAPGLLERLRRWVPVSPRRTGCVVALVGADGAGKGTVLDLVTAAVPIACSRVYLGHRRACTASGSRSESTGGVTPSPPAWREIVFVLRKAATTWSRLARVYLLARRGHIVLCDRHPYDVLATRPRRTPVGRGLELLLFARLVPRPDALVVLDAPGSELYRRKGEHSPQVLDRWRAGYRELVTEGAQLVSTLAGPEAAAREVLDVAWRRLGDRQGWPADAVATLSR